MLVGVIGLSSFVAGFFWQHYDIEKKNDIRSHNALMTSKAYRKYAYSIASRPPQEVYNRWCKLSYEQRANFWL